MLRWSENFKYLLYFSCTAQAVVVIILPALCTQGANRMRGRLGSVDGFERSSSLASEKVPSHNSPVHQTRLLSQSRGKTCMPNYVVVRFFLWPLRNKYLMFCCFEYDSGCYQSLFHPAKFPSVGTGCIFHWPTDALP